MGLARYSDDYAWSAGPSMMLTKYVTDHADYNNCIKLHTPKATAYDPQPFDAE